MNFHPASSAFKNWLRNYNGFYQVKKEKNKKARMNTRPSLLILFLSL